MLHKLLIHKVIYLLGTISQRRKPFDTPCCSMSVSGRSGFTLVLSKCKGGRGNGRRRSHCDVVWRCSVLTFARACLVLLPPPPPSLKGGEEEKWGSSRSISRELFLGLCCVFQSGHTYSTVEHQLLTSYFFWRKKRKNKNPIKFDKAFKFLLCIWPRFFLLKGMYLKHLFYFLPDLCTFWPIFVALIGLLTCS